MPNGQTSQFYSTLGIVFGTTNTVRLADRGSSDVQNSRTRNTPLGSFLFPTHHSLFSATIAFSWPSSSGRRLVVGRADSCAIGCPSRDTGAYWLGASSLGDASSPLGFHSWSVRRHCVRFIRDAHLAASPRPTALRVTPTGVFTVVRVPTSFGRARSRKEPAPFVAVFVHVILAPMRPGATLQGAGILLVLRVLVRAFGRMPSGCSAVALLCFVDLCWEICVLGVCLFLLVSPSHLRCALSPDGSGLGL
jgi:hypothetical protein